MGYADFTRNFDANDAFVKRQTVIEKKLEQHQKSSDCTGKPDCPRCCELKQMIIAEGPNLP